MRRSAIVGITHTVVEYIDDAGVQRGPFTNSEMKDWWEKLRLPKNLHIRPCDARVSANIKRRKQAGCIPHSEGLVQRRTDSLCY